MVLSLVPRKEPLVVIDESPAVGAGSGENVVERSVFHPVRGSIVSVKGDTLEELDVITGALLCHITFDLLAANGMDNILPAGPHYVVGLFQGRYFVVWDLDQAVLLSTSDIDKVHSSRRVTALATSLCVDRWLFFAAEGSNNVRVTRVDYPGPAREILRKSSLRGGSIVSLTYSTEHHLLSSGCNDGTIQVWSISTEEPESTGTKKGQDTSEFATPLFAVQLTPSPVISIVIGTCTGCGTNAGSNNLFLAAAYQNRRVDVVAMSGQTHTCVASTTLTPPQTQDFLRVSGSLSLAIHPQLPVLMVHWHSVRSSVHSDVIAAWELVNSVGNAVTSPRGGAGGNNSGGGVMTDWWNLVDASALHEEVNRGRINRSKTNSASLEGPPTILAADVSQWDNSLVVYASTMERRAIFLVDIQQKEISTSTESEIKAPLALTTTIQLTLAQYHDYPRNLPASFLQVAVKTSAKGKPVLKLQSFSQISGRLTASSDQLPDWQSERSVPLVPFQIIGNNHQSVVCIKLRERGDDAATSGARPLSFSYAVLDLDILRDTAMSDVIIDPDDESGVVAASSLPALELKPGGLQHGVRDVCFCVPPSTDSLSGIPAQAPAYLLVVLSEAGDTIALQTKRDPSIEAGSRVKLNQPIHRVFATPLLLSASSPFQSVVGCKLLYLLSRDDQVRRERLVLSEDDLDVPSSNSLLANSSWLGEPNERIVDAQWNSSSWPQIGAQEQQQCLMLAVTTTKRLVILSADLRELRTYDLKDDLIGPPQSLLWVSQTLLYTTTGKQIRYVTPVAGHLKNDASRLLCSIAGDLGNSSSFTSTSIQLLSMCGDRLCYSVSNPMSLHCRATVRPVGMCEPLLMGFSRPNAMLRRIFEREMVAFALMSDESDRPVCSVTNAVLEVAYHAFGWKEKVLTVLKALISSHEKTSGAIGASDGGGAPAAPSSNYSRTSALSRGIMASIFLDAHRWEDFIRVYLAHDPALEEYVTTIDSDGAAKLPSRMGPMSRRFLQLAAVFESIGQPDWAMRCLDLSGDDEALVTMLRKFSSSDALDALQKTWTKLNPPLSAIVKAAAGKTQEDQLSAGAALHQDPFLTLCCETLAQPIRRGRLLNSVAPLDRLTMFVAPPEKKRDLDDAEPSNETTRAGTLHWKRLAPEDTSEWLGIKAAPRLAATESRPLNYSIFAAEASAVSGVIAGTESGSGPTAFTASIPGASAEAAAIARMTIGPFQDEEDAVVAYWRFEEGGADKQAAGDAASPDGIECLDTSKRENSLRLVGGAVNFVESSAPVDRGEPGRIPEEFAIRFPSSEAPSSSLPPSGWGAHCPIRPGGTLDVATTFDEDPYRREFTFEAWVRNYKLSERQQQQNVNGDEEAPAPMSGGVRQQLVARQRVDNLDDGTKISDVTAPMSWELAIDEDDRLVFTFGSQQIRATQKIEHSGNQGWRHVAFTVDVSSPQRVGLKLYLDARCVGESQATPSSQAVSKPSRLLLGWRMQDYEMTEVRLWATARSAEQLSDMRENYLGLAEAKRRMKIAIHQRNCTCEKCVSRRAQSAAGAGPGTPRLGLALNTPLAPPSRSRRIVPQAKPT